MATYKIKPLVVGLNETDQGIMTYQRFYGERIHLPIYVFALLDGPKKILIDTGLEDFMVPEGVEKKYGFSVQHFEEALASIGWKPEDVEIIVHTHLHNDHCENDYLCSNAKVYVQKAELEALHNPPAIDHRYYDDVLDDVEVIEVEGDTQIVDGVSVLLTPGHSKGGQSVVVDTEKGKALITGFCSNEKNFPENGPAIVPGVHLDAMESWESLQKVKAFGAEILIPLHALWVGAEKTIP